jgi:adenine/guanine/hypoxanthine permease
MITNENKFHFPLFVKGDIDGFIGLFTDNLVNLLIITGLCMSINMPAELIYGRILPGAAISVLVGNIFYSYQARKLAIKERRLDVTALPYGINTVSLFAFFFFIILPVYNQTKNYEIAWKVGVASCFISGIFEGLGAFVGEKIKDISPRAALLSTLAGIAIVFIALGQTFQIWNKPIIAFIPLAFILIEYFSHARLPFKIPAGLYALVTGSIIAWLMPGEMSGEALAKSTEAISLSTPYFALSAVSGSIKDIIPFLSISIPMGLMAFFGTLQNLESASAAGDKYPAMPALAMNGIGTIVGSMFGSVFPTTVYIGHPGWKGLGARAGYSVINGIIITIICFTGFMSVIDKTIPIVAGFPILLWIGVVITAQAFQATPKEHAPAVALGLMPAIAAWGLNLLQQFRINPQTFPKELKGIEVFAEGPLLSAMFLTAVAVYLIEKNFLKAFYWTIPLIVCSYFGFIHSPSGIGIGMAGQLPLGYALFGGVILLTYFYNKYKGNQ